MRSKTAQVSATISLTTKEKLDRLVEALGWEERDVVEQALLCFIHAVGELSDEVSVRLVLDDEDFELLVEALKAPAKAPSPALKALMHGV